MVVGLPSLSLFHKDLIMKLQKILLTLVFLVVASPVFAAPKVLDLVDVPVPLTLEGKTLTKDQVKAAIIAGARDRTWIPTMHPEKKDTIIASVLVRGKHYAEVEISYSASAYSITYRNSRELKYNPDKGTIHKSYNGWINLLSNSIQVRLNQS